MKKLVFSVFDKCDADGEITIAMPAEKWEAFYVQSLEKLEADDTIPDGEFWGEAHGYVKDLIQDSVYEWGFDTTVKDLKKFFAGWGAEVDGWLDNDDEEPRTYAGRMSDVLGINW